MDKGLWLVRKGRRFRGYSWTGQMRDVVCSFLVLGPGCPGMSRSGEQKTVGCRQPGPSIIREGGRGSWAGLCLRGLLRAGGGGGGEDGEAPWEELGLHSHTSSERRDELLP